MNLNYGKIKVGSKILDDAILDLTTLKRVNKTYNNKQYILKALGDKDVVNLREISNYFYRTNGIYYRVCNYFASLYRFDWYVVPEIYDTKKAKEEKILEDFKKTLRYLDNSYIQKTCNDIALQVIRNGAYYGYLVDTEKGVFLQELPPQYCRCRYVIGNKPAIEFNMKFFDENFTDIEYRMRVLKMFPVDFQKGYVLAKQRKLTPDFKGDEANWFLLDPNYTVKFGLNNGDIPLFVNAVPALLDLEAAQELDRRKQMQKLLKIIVQKLPVDKNGDLIFDIDEATDIHNNAVEMLMDAIGVDVMTTFADVDSIDMSDSNTTTSKDDLEKVERTVFNSLGISQNLFNTDGNMSLEKSILNDEGALRNLLMQIEMFYDRVVQGLSAKQKKYGFRLYMLETTQYNYKDLSKLYKEHVQLGYSKMLPQIALGHSQSFILNSVYFENETLKLSEIMIPPLMSSTMNGETLLGKNNNSSSNKNQNITEEKTAGRPETPDDQKSDKTIANKEAMS